MQTVTMFSIRLTLDGNNRNEFIIGGGVSTDITGDIAASGATEQYIIWNGNPSLTLARPEAT